MNRLTRLALRAYPPSFRGRYGEELSALVEQLPPSPRSTADLVLGAARAWLRPRFTGPDARRRRLQASAATTWVAWCAGFLIAPTATRALLDPPVAGADETVRRLLTATQVLFAVGWCLALVGAAPVVIRLVLPALRSPARTALRPLLPALVLGMGEIGGLLWLAQVHGGVGAMLSDARLAGVIMWLIGLAAFVACLGLGPAVSLTRLEPGAAQLRVPALAAVPLALTLTALTGCALAAVALAGHGTLFGSGVPVALGLAIACLTSVVALASSVRGVRAARAV
jgi:hypothetical protein